MATPPDKTRVKAGNISLPLYRHAEGWRWAWKDPASGKWRYGTRVDRKEALAEAFKQAALLSNRQADLAASLENPDQAALMRRFLSLNLTHSDLDRIESAQTAEIHPFGQVADQFLAAKQSARGRSRRNVLFLRTQLDSLKKHFGLDRPIGTVTGPEIETWINHGDIEARTRKNRRGAAITIWRWARTRRYLPDETTAAERTEKPLVPRSAPTTWTPAELAKMWAVCPESHRPWLALSAWAGLRGEEMYQDDKQSDKDVLRWRDITSGHLEIREAASKTNRRRIVPLCATLTAFLAEERARRADEPDTAPVCPGRHASADLPVINRSATAICGEVVGGWKRNALRHSFISYRAVQIGLSRTALEAGNSESEAKRSYHDAMTEADAKAWFDPFGSSSEVLSLVEEPKIVPMR